MGKRTHTKKICNLEKEYLNLSTLRLNAFGGTIFTVNFISIVLEFKNENVTSRVVWQVDLLGTTVSTVLLLHTSLRKKYIINLVLNERFVVQKSSFNSSFAFRTEYILSTVVTGVCVVGSNNSLQCVQHCHANIITRVTARVTGPYCVPYFSQVFFAPGRKRACSHLRRFLTRLDPDRLGHYLDSNWVYKM